ncbi:hypothetical protein HNP84_007657 [Thermocatellispora tengchongensis]|uniref:Carbon monoxide dehydrogenase n=1 Tax=Thermocatellispora tengchongensis TaxID=1073253 RepID=A0A840P949_9ACTN|nr:SRPBCC domain-containing protein [Thermocatellispora tengchongensis]MBB5137904.1 hypothetical protein [Thermocatellispora tengchongensis]
MKLREEFVVARPVADVWSLLDRPEAVAGCVPGVEEIDVRAAEDIGVRVTQNVGPMTATFAATVRITEREPEKRIAFTVTGKSVRGAIGNVRASAVVGLAPAATGTLVTVAGDVALAGALGSVGQKVVAKQAGRVAAEFARRLESALGGAAPATPTARPPARPAARKDEPEAPVSVPVPVSDRWVKAAVALSGASVVLGVLILIRGWRCRS